MGIEMNIFRYILHLFKIFILTGMVLTTGCEPKIAGSISETGNGGLTGVIIDQQGFSAGHTKVFLLPADYDPMKDTVAIPIDTTDNNGNYAFSHIASGTYSILAQNIDNGTMALIQEISVNDDPVSMAPDTLKIPGSIKTMLPTNAVSSKGYVYIPGTFIYKSLNNQQDSVLLDTVPTGVIKSVSYSSMENPVTGIIRHNVRVVSQKITHILNPVWKYSGNLILNASTSGANITDTVRDFPVLVRLNSSNFIFSQAKVDGADIKFTNSNNTFLPYEIERWDFANSLAEIWVKVDTIHGSDSTQSLIMYWGNDLASSGSTSTLVFDTLNGFQGVWHLGELDSVALDATENHYNGTGYFTSPIAGLIGTAQHFNGTSSYIRMSGTAPQSRLNFPMNGSYTISAWVYHETLADSATYLIAGKGELQYFLKSFDLALSTPQKAHQWEFSEYHENNVWQAASYVPATAGAWFYLTGVRDGNNEYLYVNGNLVMEGYKILGTQQGILPRDTTDDFTIGGLLHPVSNWNQGYAYFNGIIDEVNVSRGPRNADWIKLSYMNQKAENVLVKW
jgi:hypothetical protein